LSPALAAKLLKPRLRGETRGPLRKFYAWFNRVFDRTRHHYLGIGAAFIRKSSLGIGMLVVIAVVAIFMAGRLPTAFLPEEAQGYVCIAAQLPSAASLERTEDVCKKVEAILNNTPGVQYCTTVEGFSLLSQVQATYNAFLFVTLKHWDKRTKPEEQYWAIRS